MDRICIDIKNEFMECNIDKIVKRYTNAMNEFLSFSARLREASPKYNELLLNSINKINDVYNVQISEMLVRENMYDIPMWGNVYWQFLHLFSILVSDAFEKNMILDMIDFPTILFNIHLILPCPVCKSHYMDIKDTQLIRNAIKEAAFGSPVYGTMVIHNIINKDIYSNRKPFSLSDFALHYGCVERYNEKLVKSNRFVSSGIDWQPKSHAILTRLLSIRFVMPYKYANSLIRSKYYYTSPILSSLNSHWELKNYEGFQYDSNQIPQNTNVISKPVATMSHNDLEAALSDAILLFKLNEKDKERVKNIPNAIGDKGKIDDDRLMHYFLTSPGALVDYQQIIIYYYRNHPDIVKELLKQRTTNKQTDKESPFVEYGPFDDSRIADVYKMLDNPVVDSLPVRFQKPQVPLPYSL